MVPFSPLPLPLPLLSFHSNTSPPLSLSGIYGVGQAAVHPPALAVLSHRSPTAEETICWVGKGIVYDTGGLSLKTKVHCFLLVTISQLANLRLSSSPPRLGCQG